MRSIHYAGTSLSTGDRIADRLLSAIPIGTGYAVVTFPARLDGGPIGDVQLVLSAGTQLLSQRTTQVDADAEDASLDAVVLTDADFEWFPSRGVVPVATATSGHGPVIGDDDDFDYDFEELF